jgi:hypothetical protein
MEPPIMGKRKAFLSKLIKRKYQGPVNVRQTFHTEN